MAEWTYKGRTTGRLYRYSSPVATNPDGSPAIRVQITQFGSEAATLCDRAGQVQRDVRGTPDAAHPYSTGLAPSDWSKP